MAHPGLGVQMGKVGFMDDCDVIRGLGHLYIDDVDEWYPMRFEVRAGMLCVFATTACYKLNFKKPFPKWIEKVWYEGGPLRIESGVRRGFTVRGNMLRAHRGHPGVCNPDDFIVDSEKNTIDIRLGYLLRYVLEVAPGKVDVDEVKELWLQKKRKD